MPAAAVNTLLDLDRVKEHLRLEADFTDDDDYIEQLMAVAVSMFESFTGRTLHAVGADLSDEPSTALIIEAPIIQGCLMYLAHLYSNRCAVSDRKQEIVPMGVDSLWKNYRREFF